LKIKKAAGIDSVTVEMLQAGGEGTLKVVQTLCNKLLEEEERRKQLSFPYTKRMIKLTAITTEESVC